MILQSYIQTDPQGAKFFIVNLLLLCLMKLWRVNESYFNFRVFNKQFLGLGSQGVEAVSNTATDSETFQIVRNDGDLNRVRFRAPSGFFLQVL